MGMKITDPARTIIADEAALLGWFETALPNECSIYHIGHLASDRAQETSCLTTAARVVLGDVADRVMALVERGLLIAVQQRLDHDQVVYLAIKAPPRSARPRALRMLPPLEPHRPMAVGDMSVLRAGRMAILPHPSGVAASTAAAAV
jgi:hypothetical protein